MQCQEYIDTFEEKRQTVEEFAGRWTHLKDSLEERGVVEVVTVSLPRTFVIVYVKEDGEEELREGDLGVWQMWKRLHAQHVCSICGSELPAKWDGFTWQVDTTKCPCVLDMAHEEFIHRMSPEE